MKNSPDLKAGKLLERCLSPGQLAEYRSLMRFTVTGGSTGIRYRIYCGYVTGNVQVLDGSRRGTLLCGQPSGHMPMADVHLAQKLALEGDERYFLSRAHRYGWSSVSL